MFRALCVLALFLLDAFPGCGSSRAMRPVHAGVVAIDPGRESVPHAIVRTEWTNPGPEDVRIDAYRLEWPGGAMDVRRANAIVPAGGTLLRTTRVELRHGMLPDDPATVRVTGVRTRRA